MADSFYRSRNRPDDIVHHSRDVESAIPHVYRIIVVGVVRPLRPSETLVECHDEIVSAPRRSWQTVRCLLRLMRSPRLPHFETLLRDKYCQLLIGSASSGALFYFQLVLHDLSKQEKKGGTHNAPGLVSSPVASPRLPVGNTAISEQHSVNEAAGMEATHVGLHVLPSQGLIQLCLSHIHQTRSDDERDKRVHHLPPISTDFYTVR